MAEGSTLVLTGQPTNAGTRHADRISEYDIRAIHAPSLRLSLHVIPTSILRSTLPQEYSCDKISGAFLATTTNEGYGNCLEYSFTHTLL